ncbi:N-acetyl-alpha-D-glucosaminyl L-malate synthase BshA [candidate division KSB1 bacterium]|nr:N-acetyl-alpha-D-glucosaminyl L-malate synthase BshA [candidate division KSB1 bacterium]
MKIAMVCYPTHGGSGVLATELGINLAQKGHQVHFISYSAPFRLRGFQENVYYHEVDVSAYPLFKYPPYDLSLATKIMEVVQEYHLDIVHVHYAIPHAISAYLAKKMLPGKGPKVLTTLHGTDITLVGKDESFYPAVKFGIEQSDGVTAVSRYLSERTIKEFDVKKDIKVIHNFVDTHRFAPVPAGQSCIKKRFAPNGERILMHTSNFRPVKRLTDAIEILAQVRKAMPAVMLLVGEGPDRQASHELAQKLGVLDAVEYLGTQDYIENLLGYADLFLLPSGEESFGLAALEAMSCGAPVIATRVGGLPEVITSGTDGYLFPVGDVKAMSEGAIRLLSDENLLDRFKTAARKKAVEQFSIDIVVPEYESFYAQILKQ